MRRPDFTADGLDLVQRLALAERHLFRCIDDMEEAGEEAARLDRDYRRRAKAETAALYEGRRPAAVISALVLGDDRTSQLRYERDMARLRLDVIREDINATKKCMSMWNDEINRDYYAG